MTLYSIISNSNVALLEVILFAQLWQDTTTYSLKGIIHLVRT